jgi:hypothetical protein
MVVGIGIPVTCLFFGRKFENDHAAGGRCRAFEREGLVIESEELASKAFEDGEEAFFVMTVGVRISDCEVDDGVHRNVGHGGFSLKVKVASLVFPAQIGMGMQVKDEGLRRAIRKGQLVAGAGAGAGYLRPRQQAIG